MQSVELLCETQRANQYQLASESERTEVHEHARPVSERPRRAMRSERSEAMRTIAS